MAIKFNYIRNKHQIEFDEDMTSRLLHLSTGFGGGKSYALVQKILKLSYRNKNLPGGLIGPDFREMRKDIIPLMEEILEAAKCKYELNKSEWTVKFPWTKSKLYLVSAEKKIRGPNWAYAGINEVTLIPLVRYKEVIGRVRIKNASCPQIVSVGTPEGYASEYYEYFIEKPPKSLRIIYGSTDDNAANLHENYLENLEDSFDSKMVDAYRHGLWVTSAGDRFYYSYNPKKNLDASISRDKFFQFFASIDFNVDPMCATLWGSDGYNIYGVDQVFLEGDQGFRTENLIQAMIAKGYTPHNTICYPDPAGRARSTKGLPDNTILRNAGYQVRFKTQAPSMRKRQLNGNNMLDKGRVKIHPELCKGLKKDFEGVEQDKITLEKKKDNPKLTHFSDGFDYLVDIMFPFTGDKKSVQLQDIR